MLDPLREAFYTRQVLNPLSGGQVALWHALAYTREKSHQQEWFTIAAITLAQLSGLSGTGVKKARNELKQQGLIDFRTNGTRATAYKLVDIAESVRDGVRNGARDGVRNGARDGVRNGDALLQHQHHDGVGARTREAFQLLSESEMDEAASRHTATTQQLYAAMEAAGMPMTQRARDDVEALSAEHGHEAVLSAIAKAAEYDTKGGVSVAYLRKFLESGKPKKTASTPRTIQYPVWVNGECVMTEMAVNE